jgi:hypothetical protein
MPHSPNTFAEGRLLLVKVKQKFGCGSPVADVWWKFSGSLVEVLEE